VNEKVRSLVYGAALSLVTFSLFACDLISFMQPAPTPTFTATNPPPATQTPLPTDTPVPPPTATALSSEPPTKVATEPPPAAPAKATATLSKEEAVLVYYINKDEKGPFGCGESLWYVKTHIRKTGDVTIDVKAALTTLLSFHRENFGTLYNPGYASSISVSSVEFESGRVTVYLTGEYVRTKDKCDPSRFNDQLRYTIKQFDGVKEIYIKLNGAALADALNRK
jgi:spore germination protein GerM